MYAQGIEYFHNQPIYTTIVGMGANVPIVEQNDYHYTMRSYIGNAIQEILQGADVDAALKNAEEQMLFAMGL